METVLNDIAKSLSTIALELSYIRRAQEEACERMNQEATKLLDSLKAAV